MFKCACCDECCRSLDKSDVCKESDRGDGTCKYSDENKCSIYDERRIDENYKAYFKERYSIEEYYKLNYSVCK